MNRKFYYKVLLFFIFLLPALSVSAQSVVIYGTAENFKKDEIGLYIYEDYFSVKEKLLATAAIDNSGKFKLNATIPSAKKAFLKIDNIAASLYIEPGKTYQVYFPEIIAGKEIAGNINYVKLSILNGDSKELNKQLASFNNKYDRFIEENYSLIIRKLARDKINKWVIKTRKEYMDTQNPFLKSYINYSLASMEQLAFSSKTKLYKQYLHNKPVLHDNPEYMLFFKEYYINHLLSLALSKNGEGITELINTKKDRAGLLSLLKRDSLLQHDELRELVLIYGLQEIYNNQDFRKSSINYLLQAISRESGFPENRKVAANVLDKLTKFDAGKPAPAFKLKDINGNEISLEQYKGKYVYLNFWASWCNDCLQDLGIMSELYEKYGKNIVFISISSDKKITDFIHFTKRNNYPWKFLHYGSNKRILDDYEARALPAYFFISPEGRFVEAAAESPSGGIEKKFYEVIRKTSYKKKKVGEK